MRIVDLFCGSGGFSRGAYDAGFKVAAAIDIDPVLTSSYKANFPDTKLVLADVSAIDGEVLQRHAGGLVDGIFGGPPCQGFSDIGRRDPSDARRKLLYHFFRLVAETQPTFFVMENVRGLMYADSRGELDDAIKLLGDRYEVLGPLVWDASHFGAATKRSRVFVVGMNKDRANPLTIEGVSAQKRSASTVRDAIADLQSATFVREENGFDVWRTEDVAHTSSYASSLRDLDGGFTGHRPTLHTRTVVERFAAVPQGGIDKVGRHPRLAWQGQCPTLRAGTGSDRGSYQSVRPLHPEENRVITVREGARLQGFPDSHRFHPTVWHSFRMIGNSVSPIMSNALFRAIGEKLIQVPARQQVAIAAE